MIEVHFCKLESQPDEGLRMQLLQKLPASLQETIAKYQFTKDQDRSMTGFLLLQKILQLKAPERSLEAFQRDQYERPFINGLGDFNITHSGDLVAIAFSETQRIGIDTEEFRELDLTNFTTYMNKEEWADIYAADSPNERFLYYWTIKESLLKAVGLGFRLPLEEIDLQATTAVIHGKNWHLKRLQILPGYQVHLASEQPVIDIPKFEYHWRNF